MNENLADELLGDEEYDQDKIVAIQLEGRWLAVVPGSMELSFGNAGVADVVFSVERADGQFEEGILSDITGLRSLE